MKRITFFPTVLIVVFSLFSCGSKKNPVAEAKPVAKTQNLVAQKDGPEAFFRATGMDRVWALEIAADGIKFMSNNPGESFTTPYSPPVFLAGGAGKTYKSESGKSKSKMTQIEVTITEGKCTDTITDSISTQIVKVSVKYPKQKEFTVLKGCGNYISDNKLNRVWTLAAIRGQKVIANDFGKELPYIDIHSKINAFTGFGGCNRIRGSLIYQGDLLKFTDIIATKMMCLENNKESVFMKALGGVKQYLIANNMLYLYDDKEAVLIFKK